MIRCTVLFEDKQVRDGKVKVPVVFSVNGSTVIAEGDQTCIEYRPDRPLFPYIAFRNKNSVLAKVSKQGGYFPTCIATKLCYSLK